MKKILVWIFVGILAIVLFRITFSLWENVAADEIVVIQDPFDGDLHFYFQPGLKWQGLGHVTTYHKERQYWFSAQPDQGSKKDQSIRIRFNDGGHANLSGSVRFKLPLTVEGMTKVHTLFGSEEAIEQELVRTVFEKSVYMTGPLMSSKESYAERRNDLIFYINDQAENGVYKTTSKEIKGIDPLSGKEKTITIVELVLDSANNGVKRQEKSPLDFYDLTTYNLSINKVDYDSIVEKQIASQQQAIMDVQTAMAQAKKAEQEAIRAEEQGKADAAVAKWKQEVIKAQAVTEAEQKKEVAELSMKAAEFYKKEQILKGEGDAAYKKAVIIADGALTQKINAYVEIQKAYADAFSKYQGNIVPQWVTGGSSGNSGTAENGFVQFMQLMTANAAKDLSLDLNVQKGK